MAVSRAPLWLMSATFPALAMPLAKVAFNPLRGFMTPRQFGPIIRIFPRRAWTMTCRSRSAPEGPISLNPAEMMMAARTPASTHWPITSGTVGAGVATTARSTFSDLQISAGRAHLLESGRNDDGSTDPGIDALADHVRDRRGRCGHNGQINLFRSPDQRRKGPSP